MRTFCPGAGVGHSVGACVMGRARTRETSPEARGDPASRSEPGAVDVTHMGSAEHRPVVTAPVRRRRRLPGLSAEAAIAAQVWGFPKGTGKTEQQR